MTQSRISGLSKVISPREARLLFWLTVIALMTVIANLSSDVVTTLSGPAVIPAQRVHAAGEQVGERDGAQAAAEVDHCAVGRVASDLLRRDRGDAAQAPDLLWVAADDAVAVGGEVRGRGAAGDGRERLVAAEHVGAALRVRSCGGEDRAAGAPIAS